MNAFSYWQNQAIGNATATYFDDLMQAIGHIQTVSGSLDAVHVMNGETGWPTGEPRNTHEPLVMIVSADVDLDGGSSYGPAIAGTSNANHYWKSGVCGMLDWGVDLFYFEAFDEPNKADAIGQDGSPANEKHWGALNADRSIKFDLSC